MGQENKESFRQLSEEIEDEKVDTGYDEAIKLNEIKNYEKQNNVDQDTIARSYLVHVDLYKSLSEELKETMDKFYLIEKSNGSDHPATYEAKLDLNIIKAKVDNERKIMNPMLENLTKETIEKYKYDMDLRGVFGDAEKK